MYIFIFVLKLFEYLLYKELASGYPSIIISISNNVCILASIYSLLIFIIIYFYIKNKNKIGDKRKIMIISIILLIFTIALIYLVVITFSHSYFPSNLKICRSVGLLLSIIICTFVIYKGKILKT